MGIYSNTQGKLKMERVTLYNKNGLSILVTDLTRQAIDKYKTIIYKNRCFTKNFNRLDFTETDDCYFLEEDDASAVA